MITGFHMASILAGRLARRVQLAAALCLSLPALALSPIPPTGGIPPQWRPVTLGSSFSQGQPIQLREALVDVHVFGDQAQTRMELRLFNPNHRVLEGELQFPLLDGQVVTGFALDVNGSLRDAVPVPKAKGQEIFEDIRRRRVDPGLLEGTAGNQYKLRVYPIMGQGERRVTITVTETLPRNGGAAMLRVPLAFAATVGRLQLRVQAHGVVRQEATLMQAPAGTELLAEGTGLALRLDRRAWTVTAGPAGWLQLALRQGNKPQIMVGESAGKRFFAGHLPLRDEPVRRPAPRHIALVWDGSGSAAAQGRVLPVLDAYFRALRQPVKLSLIVMRNRPEPVRTLTIAPGGFAELAALLRAQPLDGSSNFDKLPVPSEVDTTLMVTDGLMTDGQRLINYTHTAPVFAINGAQAADLPRLHRLADRTGGAVIDATQLSPVQAARAMLFDGWRIAALSSPAAEDLVAPSLRVQQGRIAVAGALQGQHARVDISLVHPSGRRRTLALQVQGQAAQGRWPAQQWAIWRSAELAENANLHDVELRRIAAAHGIVGPNSSLIVLELAADYARYELPAPPELADEVARLGHLRLEQTAQARHNHVEAMVRQFDERQRWWDREFPKAGPKRLEQQLVAKGAVGRVAETVAAVRPAIAAAPAPAAPVAASPARNAASQDAAKQARAQDEVAAPATIALQAWTPDAPYLRRLQEAGDVDLYRVYLDERPANQASSAFYMDVAGLFLERGQPELGLRILSNLAEMNLENRQLLRLYAYRLLQAHRPDLAVPVFARVSELAPNEPQSWRDLGLALAESGQPQRAVHALWEVVSRPWNPRFAGIGMIALAELNAIASQAQAGAEPLDLGRIDPRLRRNLPLALRVVMAWDTDDTDIDLWITDPNGERASYANRLSHQGGAVSPDATGGYGPEEFSLKTAKAGKYRVEAQFYGNRQQVLSAGTTVMVRVTTGFGTPQARDEWTSLRLVRGSELARVAEIEVR